MDTHPLYDLIELKDLKCNTVYSKENGGILGVVDNAIYGADDDNKKEIVEINQTNKDGGYLTIGGTRYFIDVAAPKGKNDPVTMTKGDGQTVNLQGNDLRSDIVFITARPDPDDGSPVRYFAVIDDKFGDFNVKSIETRHVDFDPSGNDVKINAGKDNDIKIVCFAAGTLIETADGARKIEEIKTGDLVMTIDHGLQAVAWMGKKKLSAGDLAVAPSLRPIRIAAGALGSGVPNADLLVSPQHRVLLRSAMARSIFGADEVLAAAKQLVLIDGIDIADDLEEVAYYHMLFRDHEIILSNGAETESLYTGPEALKSVGENARKEIFSLFPELDDDSFVPEAARYLAPNRMARKLAKRHVQHSKPLVS